MASEQLHQMTDDERWDWFTSLLDKVNKAEEVASRDKRATAAYWNGDDWGSISGFRDAREWVDGHRKKVVIDELRAHLGEKR